LSRARRRALACLLLLGGTGGATAWATGASAEDRTLVELFTAQGCAECPGGDALLAELAARPDVLGLTLPVDYWDTLGWKDTLALPGHTKRQWDYAHKHDLDYVFTPEMVIDGTDGVPASDRVAVVAALAKAEKAERVGVSVERGRAALVVRVDGKVEMPAAKIWLVRFDPRRTVGIGAGANRGKSLVYVNVVRAWRDIGTYQGEPVTLAVPDADLARDPGEGVAILVQADDGKGAILGTALYSGALASANSVN
jgi:hypothetical protein